MNPVNTISRHFRVGDQLVKNKNDILAKNAEIIANIKSKDECVNLLKFTIGTITGKPYPEGTNEVLINAAFTNNTNFLTGNKNQCSWVARDVTRGAMMQIFLLCCRLEQIATGNVNSIEGKTELNTDKFNLVMEHLKANLDDNLIQLLNESLLNSSDYLDACSFDSTNNTIRIHSLFGGYKLNVAYDQVKQTSAQDHNKIVDCSNDKNMANVRFSFFTVNVNIEHYTYSSELNRFVFNQSSGQGTLTTPTILSSSTSKIDGECIIYNNLFELSVKYMDGKFGLNSTGKIFLPRQNKSYDYKVGLGLFVWYDITTESVGKCQELTELEARLTKQTHTS